MSKENMKIAKFSNRFYFKSKLSILSSSFLTIILLSNLSLAINPFQIAATSAIYATTEDEEGEDGQQEEEEVGQQPEGLTGTGTQPTQSQQQLQQQAQQQPAIQDFIISGKINSVLPIGNNTWLADGNWNMNVENGEVNSFVTKMTWTSADGNKSHTHEFENFEPIGSADEGISMSPADSLLLEGEMSVGTNGVFDWEDVPARIYFGNGRTMTVLLDDEATNQHFGRQPIYGLVTSFTPCGAPGPNMEVLPRC